MVQHAQESPVSAVAEWVDDLAGHAAAVERIGGLGDAAIAPLRDYLARDPQAIPQARCFAVAMLARLHAAAATDALRGTLRAHPLGILLPPFAESEYVVKSDVLQALLRRSYPELADDIAFGVRERLSVAVAAAGGHHLTQLADTLVDVLDDDVLAEAAVASLVAMGPHAADAIVPRLDAWLTEAEWSARRRLALIRALRVMHRVAHSGMDDAPRRALDASHPTVRAGAALLAAPAHRDAVIIDALLHGALGFDRELADDCREALRQVGAGLLEPARRALARNAEPDLYGRICRPSSEQHDWLAKRLRQLERDMH